MNYIKLLKIRQTLNHICFLKILEALLSFGSTAEVCKIQNHGSFCKIPTAMLFCQFLILDQLAGGKKMCKSKIMISSEQVLQYKQIAYSSIGQEFGSEYSQCGNFTNFPCLKQCYSNY